LKLLRVVTPSIALCATLVLASAGGVAADHEVVQKDKAFSVGSLTIKAGDSVSFKNLDPFVHNVFSLTEPQPFDLGTTAQGQSSSISFEHPGTFEVECAIHPEMKITVKVTK
jgi:plastocyanin